MSVPTFTAYNIAGGVLWAVVIPLIGFGLAHVMPVKHNLVLITLTVGTLSCIPLVIEFVRARRRMVADR